MAWLREMNVFEVMFRVMLILSSYSCQQSSETSPAEGKLHAARSNITLLVEINRQTGRQVVLVAGAHSL